MHPTKREKSVEEMKLSHGLKLLKILVDVTKDAKCQVFFFPQNCFKNPPKYQGCLLAIKIEFYKITWDQICIGIID